MARLSWFNQAIKDFGKEAVEEIFESRGLSEAFKDGAGKLSNKQKSSIIEQLTAVSGIKKQGGELLEAFNGLNPKSFETNEQYEFAVRSLWKNKDSFMDSVSQARKAPAQLEEQWSKLSPDEAAKKRQNWERRNEHAVNSGYSKPNQRTHELQQKELEASFNPEPSVPKSRAAGESRRDFNEVWNSMSDEQKAKWNDMKKRQKAANNEAYGLDEKHGYIPDADDMSNRSMTREEYNQKRKEAFDNSAEGKERAKIEKDQRREKAAQERQEKLRQEREMKQRASEETGGQRAEKQRKAYEERKRLEEFEDTKERGVIGMAFHKLGNGISAAFGVQNVKTNAAGEVVNEFAARNTIRTNMNAYNRYQAKTGGAKISSDDFMKGYGVFDEETLGNFSQRLGTMEQSSNFDGLGDWAKEHPMLVAGAIAGTAVGGASIISNMRDGD